MSDEIIDRVISQERDPLESTLQEHILNCPILRDIMEDPVVAADGHTYERVAIAQWIQSKGARATSPMTGLPLAHLNLASNHFAKSVIKLVSETAPARKLKQRTQADLALAIKLREEELLERILKEGSTRTEHAETALADTDARHSKVEAQRVGLFKRPAHAFDEKALAAFLQHVTLGEQDKAEAMLKETPALVLGKGTCKDHAGRTFTNITGFQYALWALDWHMWKMILPYFDKLPEGKVAASEQCSRQEALTKGLGHGPRYKMEDLVNALKTYIDRFNELNQANNWNELKRLWVQGVGGAQRKTVAHVAQAYCNPERSFYPCPNWESEEVMRGVTIAKGWFSSGGADQAWTRGWREDGAWQEPFTTWPPLVDQDWLMGRPGRFANFCFTTRPQDLVQPDRSAIEGLCRVRTVQMSELKSSLAIPSPSVQP